MASTETHQYASLFLSDISEVKKVFDRFDTNGDGLISRDELSNILIALGSEPSEDELDRMMDELDCNKDGFVNLEEFADFCSRKTGSGDEETDARELREAFDMYDQDKNGLISATELHLVLSRLGERCSVQDCTQMIHSVDSDGDGSVDFDEFRKMMTKSSS